MVAVPPTLGEEAVDELLEAVHQALGSAGPAGRTDADSASSELRVLLDARRVRWVDPPGMLGLLGAARLVHLRTGHRARIHLPESRDVSGYLARMNLVAAARAVAEIDDPPNPRGGRPSDALLEVTSIAENRDVHQLVEHVQERAGAILSRTLGYPMSAVLQFSVLLSEVCGNILEHADAPGWVAAQSYHWERRLGRHVLVVAVGDAGVGFRGSLADRHAGRYGARWSDATALEAAFIHGITRFPDQGRGQGIQQIRRQVRRWGGLISIRSGTARIADVPEWDDRPPLQEGLPELPGAWITIILPARGPQDPSGPGQGGSP